MSTTPIRFVHASDLHLDRLPQDLAEIPEHLRERLVAAPIQAATKVFDAAVNDAVDFVVLSGDVISLERALPSHLLFLVEQFSRLAAREIPVFWLGGRAEALGEWPHQCVLPLNVNQFPVDHVGEHVVRRQGQAIARVLGQSFARGQRVRPADFEPGDGDLPVIAVAHGKFEAAALAKADVTYWALGGQHEASTIATGKCTARYSGSPQGRRLREQGSHGCTRVSIGGDGRVTLSMITTDVIRYESPRLEVAEGTTREQLEAQLREAVVQLQTQSPDVDRLISWSVTGIGPLLQSMRRGSLGGELLQWLRAEFGSTTPATWSIELNVEPPEIDLTPWADQETLLGDFLRAVVELDRDDAGIDLRQYVEDEGLVEALTDRIRLDDAHSRQLVLRQAALLGTDLLGGEEPGE